MSGDLSNLIVSDSSLDELIPSHRISFADWFARIFLQLGQRAGAVAFFATIAAWVMLYLEKDATVVLSVAVATSLIGFGGAFIARRLMTNSTGPDEPLNASAACVNRRELNSVSSFNLILLGLGIQLMLFTHMQLIRSAVTHYFTSPADATRSQAMHPPR